MKKSILFLGVIIYMTNLQAQQEKVFKTSVKKAIVYLQGAQLYSSEVINILPGTTDIVFEGVSPLLQESGIQASGKGNFVITDTRFERQYRERKKVIINHNYQQQIENIVDSIDDIDFAMLDAANRNTTLETEKRMLLTNRIITGQTQKDSLQLLKEGMIFLRERLNNIYAEQLKITKENKRLGKLKSKLEARKQSLELLQNGVTTEEPQAESVNRIIVSVYAEALTSGSLTVSYFVSNAGWIPYYEIHGNSNNEQIQLKELASIYQNSQVDWKDASIILSTGLPESNATKPVLNQWYIGYYASAINKTEKALSRKTPVSAAPKAYGSVQEDQSVNSEDDAKNMAEMVNVSESMILTEYELKLKYHIPADGKMHIVSILNKDMPASYFYAAVPKLDLKAYLMARIVGWEDLNLIPGKAKIYFDGNLAGNTYISANEATDTLLLNMGRDNSLVLQKRKLKDISKIKYIHDQQEKTIGYEIVIRNTKNIPIYITIEDQIPLVQPGITNMKVELVDADGASLDETSGKLTWNIKVPVKENRKIQFKFKVIGDKGANWSGLNI